MVSHGLLPGRLRIDIFFPIKKTATVPIVLCLIIAAAAFSGCARKHVRDINKLERTVEAIRKNNRNACTPGCIAFDGDSNMEIINFQEYLTEPACNYALRGSTTEEVLKRKEMLHSLNPDAIIVLVGGNDIIKGTTPGDISRNYLMLIRYYRTFCKKVYFISNLPVDPNIYIKNSDMMRLNERLRQICKNLGATYVNVYPHLLKDGGLNPDYAIDPVHLNKAGQNVLVDILKKYLQ
ncbi:MAG: hypothetical protein A2176_06405 [Spirochaetes bacterium RBG_13_51_14]|nr:MAG: hypothetical protein A2176_06405 [Spirochaetes bacterium RBG_13_51_14]